MKNLKVLYLKGNPVCRNISFYRKTLIKEIENMTYLDDRPVDQGERLAAIAFFSGGIEAEKKARQEWLRNKNMSIKVHEQEQRNQVLFEERKKKSLESLTTEYNHRKNYLEERIRQVTREMNLNPIKSMEFEIQKKSIEYQIEENEKMKEGEESDIMKTCSKRENFEKFAVFEYEDWMDDLFEKRVVENFFDFTRAVRLIKLDLQMRNVKNWEIFNELDLRIRWTELEIKKFSKILSINNSNDKKSNSNMIDETAMKLVSENLNNLTQSIDTNTNINKFELTKGSSSEEDKNNKNNENTQNNFPREEIFDTNTNTNVNRNPALSKVAFEELD